MRVTNSMIANRVLLNAQSSLSRLLEMQTQMSSGKRINKPSDDPLGIIRDLDYRNELSKISQFQENINQSYNWTSAYDQEIFPRLDEIVRNAKEIAVSGTDDSYNADSRAAFAAEVRSHINSLLQLGNSQTDGGRYLFSGYSTDVESFQRNANGFSFNGDNGIINYQIDSASDLAVNLIGSDVYLGQIKTLGEDADLNVAVTGTTLLADLHNGQGIDQTVGTFEIRDLNLGINVTIDVTGATTIDDVLTQINTQLTANGITDVTARISDVKNSIMFETSNSNIVSLQTPLENLNGGGGVELVPGIFKVSDGSGIDVNIDISGATTIGDVINEFNSQLAAAGVTNVTMGLNAGSTGFEITDTNGVPLNLSITDVSSQDHVAEQLGITGSISPTLTGDDLLPQPSFEIVEQGGTTAADLGILGSFNSNFAGEDINPALTLSSNLSDLNNGLGLSGGEITIWQGETNKIINLDNTSLVTVQDLINTFNATNLDITVSLNDAGTGIQIVNNDTTKSFTIENIGEGRGAKDLGIYGSSDMIGSFFVLANALDNNDNEAVGELIDNFDLSINHVLNYQALVGSKEARLQATSSRLSAQEFIYTQRLSEVEDADITKLVTDLSTYENNYQASLLASSKIIQPSLLDFLR